MPEVDLLGAVRAALELPLERGGGDALADALRGAHPADIAEALNELSRSEALTVFNWLDNAVAAEVLDQLNDETTTYLVENSPRGRIAQLLDILPMDDAAEIISEASPERAEELLSDLTALSPADAAEVRELLSYREGTAGRLMTDKFISIEAGMTVRQAFRRVRRADKDVETLTDIYVVESVETDNPGYERLIGVLSLRQLVRSKLKQTIEEVMTTELVTVTVDTDQEEVARLISKYDFLAMPVLDRAGRIAGIVTVDDVVDVLVEEQTEDIYKLGAVGAPDRPYLAVGVLNTFRRRFGWLLLLFVAGTLTGSVLRLFEGDLSKTVALSVFIPLLIGTGGNAGSQAVMTITRALALGEIRFGEWLRVFWRETRAGLLLGAALGTIGYFRALLWETGPDLALVVGLSMIAIVVWANMVGSLLPIAAKRLGLDPAVMSAPFITTLVDATGLFLYFSIAHVVLKT
jgi:magnesium transporter